MSIRWYIISCIFVALLLLVIGAGQPLPGHAADDAPTIIAPKDTETCLGCHSEKVNVKHFAASAHSKLVCQNCHQGIDRFPHPEKAVFKPQCITCHGDKSKALSHSVHGKDATTGQTPNCQSCHGTIAHEIVKPASLSKEQREASCRNCHRDKAELLAKSIHAGGGKHPTCLSCHGGNPHAISTPPKVASPKQDATCRQCHAADTARMLSSAHGKAISATGKGLNCLTCHGGNPHAIASPMKASGPQKAALCEKCHADKAKLLAASAHGNTDMQGGNHPNCLSCHGEQLHAIIPPGQMAPQEKDAACKSCHSDIAQRLAASVHREKQGDSAKPAPGCLSCHGGGNPHTVVQPQKLTPVQRVAPCLSCHADLAKTLAASVHNRPDKQPGDHPTCLTCHGGSPHDIAPPKHLTPIEKVELCAKCHADKPRMARYGRTDAVEAYERTFHGRAIMQFHQTKQATCVDCHGLHGIMAPDDPNAPTNPRHAAEICGKCHKGTRMDFAYTYATHLRLNVERSVMSPLQHGAFTLLNLAPYLLLLVVVVLGAIEAISGKQCAGISCRLLDIFDLVCLFALLSSLIALITFHLLTMLGESNAHWPEIPAAIAALMGLVALAVKRWIFTRP